MYYKKKEKKTKNNILQNHVLIKQLIKSKNQYGCYSKTFNPENKPFIYGFKFKQSVLNVEQTCIGLKKIFFLIHGFLLLKKSRKKILIICSDYQKKKLTSVLLHSRILNLKIELQDKWEKGFLIRNSEQYHLIILFSSTNFEIIRRETEIQRLPIISFLGTEMSSNKFKQINYPIFYNNKKFESIYFMFSLLVNFFKKSNDTKT